MTHDPRLEQYLIDLVDPEDGSPYRTASDFVDACMRKPTDVEVQYLRAAVLTFGASRER